MTEYCNIHKQHHACAYQASQELKAVILRLQALYDSLNSFKDDEMIETNKALNDCKKAQKSIVKLCIKLRTKSQAADNVINKLER